MVNVGLGSTQSHKAMGGNVSSSWDLWVCFERECIKWDGVFLLDMLSCAREARVCRRTWTPEYCIVWARTDPLKQGFMDEKVERTPLAGASFELLVCSGTIFG